MCITTGSGIVVRIGQAVTAASVGDPVLLSFNSCGTCGVCISGHPNTCVHTFALNFAPREGFLSSSTTSESGPPERIYGRFFGQSSFASLSVVQERCVVNVKGLVSKREDLQLLAPLGCGVQTGSGTILNAGQAGESDAVIIMGLGGVGLSGVMVRIPTVSIPLVSVCVCVCV
jgi:Zn-dependent alcohol dehydrogenase